jgi:hypothetical protein
MKRSAQIRKGDKAGAPPRRPMPVYALGGRDDSAMDLQSMSVLGVPSSAVAAVGSSAVGAGADASPLSKLQASILRMTQPTAADAWPWPGGDAGGPPPPAPAAAATAPPVAAPLQHRPQAPAKPPAPKASAVSIRLDAAQNAEASSAKSLAKLFGSTGAPISTTFSTAAPVPQKSAASAPVAPAAAAGCHARSASANPSKAMGGANGATGNSATAAVAKATAEATLKATAAMPVPAPAPAAPSAAPASVEEFPPLSVLLHSRLLKPVTEKMKITALTRVQRLCWAALSNPLGDVMVRSETGSGQDAGLRPPHPQPPAC